MAELSQKDKLQAITANGYEVEMYCVSQGTWKGVLRDSETGYAWPFMATNHEDLIESLYFKYEELNNG